MLQTFLLTFISFVSSVLGIGSFEVTSQLTTISQTADVESVTDGDTITVKLHDTNEIEKVRYIGIDTPEPYRENEPECYSKEASERNSELVEGKEVVLVSDIENRDRYGRLLRYVYVDTIMVNEVLVKEGFGEVLSIKPNTKYEQIFTEFRNHAREEKKGMWGVCDI